MKDLRSHRADKFLRDAIAQGEHECQDFKFQISDARKIARTISAFANHRGGRLLIGVKDNGVVAGVRNEEDIYVVEQAATMYCRPEQKVEFEALRTSDGLVVIKAEVEAATHKPVQAQDADGRWRAYRRVADENILATPLMVKAWREAARDTSRIFSLSSKEQNIMELLDRQSYITLNLIMIAGHLSRQKAESIITTLYAMRHIEFDYRAGEGFIIKRLEDTVSRQWPR